jgi:hypothetical protein
MVRNSRNKTAVIANGASLSGSVYLGSLTLLSIIMPAAWTAASLTFQVSNDGTNWNNLYDTANTEVAYTVAAGNALAVEPDKFAGWRFLKVRSGTTAAAVAQAAERTFTLRKGPVLA